MRKAKAARGVGKRVKHFEKQAVDTALDKFVSSTTKSLEKKQSKSESKELSKYEAALDRYFDGIACWGNKPGVVFDGSNLTRKMRIHLGNEAYSLCLRRVDGLTKDDLLLLIRNPKEFPNPELVYSYISNTYYISWDGKL